ncbi:MAG: hypothetical protein ABIG11_07040 [bacterium]
MPDYFPLKKNLRLKYVYTSSEFENASTVLIDIISVDKKGKSVRAKARMTIDIKGTATSAEYTITRDSKWIVTGDGIVVGGRKEIPVRPVKGARWDAYPDASEVVSVNEKVRVPAGRFNRCVKVVTRLAGGDAGSAVRYYAPGTGFVLEKYSGENMQAEVKLVSAGTVAEPAKPSRRKR